MTDFKVNYPELRAASSGFEGLERSAQAQRATLDGVALGQSDFGRIPWLQTRVFEAFTEHTTECRESLRELTEALNMAAEGLAATADSYEDFETAAAEAIDQFFEELR